MNPGKCLCYRAISPASDTFQLMGLTRNVVDVKEAKRRLYDSVNLHETSENADGPVAAEFVPRERSAAGKHEGPFVSLMSGF